MAATFTNAFTQTGLLPALGGQHGKRMPVRLPASVTYPKGTVLGEVTGNNEVQTITLATSGTLGGTYTLSFANETTAAIAFNATAAQVQTALELLSTTGAGNVAVTGTTPSTSGGTLTVTFQGLLGYANVPAMTLGAGSLTSDMSSAVTTATAGSSGSKGNNELVAVKLGTGGTLGGTFTLTFGGVTSAAIAYNASVATIQAALDAMSTLGPSATQVLAGAAALGTSGGTFLIMFTGANAFTDVGAVTGSTAGLTGASPTLTVTKIFDGVAVTSVGLYKAYVYSATDGSQNAKCLLEFDAATDASGNITLGTGSSGGEHQQTQTYVTAYVSGDFFTQDLVKQGAGSLDNNAVTQLGRLVEGTVVNGILRLV